MRVPGSTIPFILAGLLAGCLLEELPEEIGEADSELIVITNPHTWRPPSPRWNHVFGKATHNSYHFVRDSKWDWMATGTSEQLIDQLLIERAGSVEFDIQPGDGAGVFRVAHTDRPDFSGCNPLTDCLEMLRSFHYATPDHDPILVIVELKGNPLIPYGRTFVDGAHTIEHLDKSFRDVFGDLLYQPAEFLADCPGYNLSQCLEKRGGWPTLDELRGRFVVAVMGNWHNNYNDWVAYGGRDDIRLRAGFPIRCIYDPEGGGIFTDQPFNAGGWMDEVDLGRQFQARANSIILQVEPGEHHALAWYENPQKNPLRGLQLVRGGQFDKANLAEVLDGQHRFSLAYGHTWFSTDWPWRTFIEHGPGPHPETPTSIDFRRRYFDPRLHVALRDWVAAQRAPIHPGALLEPGQRIFVSAPDYYWPFLYTQVPAGSYRFWETTVSLTRRGDTHGDSQPRVLAENGRGCLRAAASDVDWIEVCRSKDGGAGQTEIQDRTVVTVRTRSNGTISNETYRASVYHRDSIGAHLAMEVELRGPGSMVRLYTAGTIGKDGQPEWRLLKELTVPFALDKQGLGTGTDVLFAGTRWRDESGVWRNVTKCDLVNVDDFNPAPVVPTIVNASVPAAKDEACVPSVVKLPPTTTPISTSWKMLLKDAGSEPTIVNRLDGTRVIFYRAFDGSIRHTQAGDGFAGGNLGGWLAWKAPVVGRHPDGRFHVFAIGGDAAVWHTWELSPGGVWSGWSSLGGSIADVTVGTNLDGRLELFAAGTDGVIYQKWETSVGGTFSSGWHPMSTGPMGGAPAVTSHKDGRQILFVRGTDGAIWTRSQAVANGGWGAWGSLGGGLVGRPTAMRDSWGYVVLFAKGTDGNIWSRTQTAPSSGAFSGWTQRSWGGGTGNPVVVPMADGGWDVFSRNADHSVVHMTQGRGWWATVAGRVPGWAGIPAVGRKRDGRMTVVATDYRGTLWETEVP